MTLWDWQRGIIEPWPEPLVDILTFTLVDTATGKEVPDVLWFNDSTGEYASYVRDAKGAIVCSDDNGPAIATGISTTWKVVGRTDCIGRVDCTLEFFPTPLNIHFAIMAVPEREDHVKAQVEDLTSQGVGDTLRTYYDSAKRGPWYTAKKVWERINPEATHQVCIQDDAILCRNFVAGVKAAIAARPTEPISFFLSDDEAVAFAQPSGRHWQPVTRFGAVAIALPATLAREFIEWQEPFEPDFDKVGLYGGSNRWGLLDDARLWRFLMFKGIPMQATMPSLVEHGGAGQSTIREAYAPDRRDEDITASWFIGDDDPALIDWSK